MAKNRKDPMDLTEAYKLACPCCRQKENLRIQIPVMCDVTVDGTEDLPGDREWDDDSYAQCPECGFYGDLWQFGTGRGTVKKRAIKAKVEAFKAKQAAQEKENERYRKENEKNLL